MEWRKVVVPVLFVASVAISLALFAVSQSIIHVVFEMESIGVAGAIYVMRHSS
jgi:uncharacterized membrane protein YqhA